MGCVIYCFWNVYYKDKLFDFINENCCCGLLEYCLCVFEICSSVKENIDLIKDYKDKEENVRIEMKIIEKNNIENVDGRKRVML